MPLDDDRTYWAMEPYFVYGDDLSDTIDLHLVLRSADGRTARVTEVLSEMVDPVIAWRPAIGHIRQASMQRIMDQLWGMGFRPKDDATHGQLAAMSNHLTDMRVMTDRLLTKFLKDR